MTKKKSTSSNNKKKTKKTMTKTVTNTPNTTVDLNTSTIEALTRLDKALCELDSTTNTTTTTTTSSSSSPEPSNDDVVGLPLGHWRDLTGSEVETAYKMMDDGAELVKASSTKYTLLGKIDLEDGSKLTEELRKGCELIATSTFLLHQPLLLCSRPTRHYAKQYARAIIATVRQLVQSFAHGDATDNNTTTNNNNNVGAVKTGAVWSACDALLGKLPRGNRGCMRRELFTWVGDCNETMGEFQELVDLGVVVVEEEDGDGEEEDGWDTFCENKGTGDSYIALELPISTASVALIRCSRGVLNLVLKACECAGAVSIMVEGELTKRRRQQQQNITTTTEQHGDTDTSAKGGEEEEDISLLALEQRRDLIWQWISTLHEMAQRVGEGVTDLGMAMYPPIDLHRSCNNDAATKTTITTAWDDTTLGNEVSQQRDCLIAILKYVMEDESISRLLPGIGGSGIHMSEEVMEMGSKLRSAIDVRVGEIELGFGAALLEER